MAALSPRKVLILNPLGSNLTPASENNKSDYLTYPKIVYSQKGIKDNFKCSVVEEGQLAHEQIISWLK